MSTDKFVDIEEAYELALSQLEGAALAYGNRLGRTPADDSEGNSTPEEMAEYLRHADSALAWQIAQLVLALRKAPRRKRSLCGGQVES